MCVSRLYSEKFMKRKSLGIALIVTPPVLLFGTIVLYAIATFVVGALTAGGTEGEGWARTAQLVNTLLGLSGLLSVFGILIGIPVGIILLVTGEKKSGS